MGCGCKRRKKAWLEKQAAKKAKGQNAQAAVIGAALAVTEAAGKVLGIHGEVEDGTEQQAAASESAATGE